MWGRLSRKPISGSRPSISGPTKCTHRSDLRVRWRTTGKVSSAFGPVPRIPMYSAPILRCLCRWTKRRSTSCAWRPPAATDATRSEEHTSELQSLAYLVCRLLLEKKKKKKQQVQFIKQKKIHKE